MKISAFYFKKNLLYVISFKTARTLWILDDWVWYMLFLWVGFRVVKMNSEPHKTDQMHCCTISFGLQLQKQHNWLNSDLPAVGNNVIYKWKKRPISGKWSHYGYCLFLSWQMAIFLDGRSKLWWMKWNQHHCSSGCSDITLKSLKLNAFGLTHAKCVYNEQTHIYFLLCIICHIFCTYRK